MLPRLNSVEKYAKVNVVPNEINSDTPKRLQNEEFRYKSTFKKIYFRVLFKLPPPVIVGTQ